MTYLSKFFKFSKDNEPDPKYNLYSEMRSALYEYTVSMQQYKSVVDEYDEFSTLTQIAYATMEHHRTEYYKLRLEYERDYGNAEIYEDSLNRVDSWVNKTGLTLLMRPINDPYLRNRILG